MAQQIGGDSSQTPLLRMTRIPFIILLQRKVITVSVRRGAPCNMIYKCNSAIWFSGTVPVTFVAGDMTTPSHASFKGTVLFQNVFHGKLPASDYPKIRVRISVK